MAVLQVAEVDHIDSGQTFPCRPAHIRAAHPPRLPDQYNKSDACQLVDSLGRTCGKDYICISLG